MTAPYPPPFSWPLVWTKETADACTEALHAMNDALGRLPAPRLVDLIQEAFEIEPRFTHVRVAFNAVDSETLVFMRTTVPGGEDEEVSLGHDPVGSGLSEDQGRALENIYFDIDGLLNNLEWGNQTRKHLASVLASPLTYARADLELFRRDIAGHAQYEAWKATQEASHLDASLPPGVAATRRRSARL